MSLADVIKGTYSPIAASPILISVVPPRRLERPTPGLGIYIGVESSQVLTATYLLKSDTWPTVTTHEKSLYFSLSGAKLTQKRNLLITNQRL